MQPRMRINIPIRAFHRISFHICTLFCPVKREEREKKKERRKVIKKTHSTKFNSFAEQNVLLLLWKYFACIMPLCVGISCSFRRTYLRANAILALCFLHIFLTISTLLLIAFLRPFGCSKTYLKISVWVCITVVRCHCHRPYQHGTIAPLDSVVIDEQHSNIYLWISQCEVMLIHELMANLKIALENRLRRLPIQISVTFICSTCNLAITKKYAEIAPKMLHDTRTVQHCAAPNIPKCSINIRRNWCHSAIIRMCYSRSLLPVLCASTRVCGPDWCGSVCVCALAHLPLPFGEGEESVCVYANGGGTKRKNKTKGMPLMITFSCNVFFIWLFNFHVSYLNTLLTEKYLYNRFYFLTRFSPSLAWHKLSPNRMQWKLPNRI